MQEIVVIICHFTKNSRRLRKTTAKTDRKKKQFTKVSDIIEKWTQTKRKTKEQKGKIGTGEERKKTVVDDGLQQRQRLGIAVLIESRQCNDWQQRNSHHIWLARMHRNASLEHKLPVFVTIFRYQIEINNTLCGSISLHRTISLLFSQKHTHTHDDPKHYKSHRKAVQEWKSWK